MESPVQKAEREAKQVREYASESLRLYPLAETNSPKKCFCPRCKNGECYICGIA